MGTRSVRAQWDVCGMHFLPGDEGQPATSRLPRAPPPPWRPRLTRQPPPSRRLGGVGVSPGAARGHHLRWPQRPSLPPPLPTRPVVPSPRHHCCSPRARIKHTPS